MKHKGVKQGHKSTKAYASTRPAFSATMARLVSAPACLEKLRCCVKWIWWFRVHSKPSKPPFKLVFPLKPHGNMRGLCSTIISVFLSRVILKYIKPLNATRSTKFLKQRENQPAPQSKEDADAQLCNRMWRWSFSIKRWRVTRDLEVVIPSDHRAVHLIQCQRGNFSLLCTDDRWIGKSNIWDCWILTLIWRRLLQCSTT